MNQKLIREIGRTQRLDILTFLKRRGPLTVREMAAHFGMSYMGIKQHCLELEKEGYLDTWRRPSRVGRPEMLYRLTARGLEVFPKPQNEWTMQVLEAVERSYGPAAPTKMLFGIFAQRTEAYRRKAPGSTPEERGAALAQARAEEGYLSEFGWAERARGQGTGGVDLSAGGGGDFAVPGGQESRAWCIVEYHSPIEDLLRRFPIIARLERELFERVIGVPVRREEIENRPGYYQCVFYLG